MADTSIEWTDKTWNPTVGCTRISPGCKLCYAHRLHDLRHAAYLAGKPMPEQYAQPFTTLQMLTSRLEIPLHWKKPKRVFVNSMSDLLHADVPEQFIASVFATMLVADQHTYQVLTKHGVKSGRLAWLLSDSFRRQHLPFALGKLTSSLLNQGWSCDQAAVRIGSKVNGDWPPAHILLGVSIEDQPRADERLPQLSALHVAGWRTFVSYEPALGPVKWAEHEDAFDWLIAGGESGDGARPSHPDWPRAARDFCQKHGIPFLFKQWGEWRPWYGSLVSAVAHNGKLFNFQDGLTMQRVGKRVAGRLLDGKLWDEFPLGQEVATCTR